MTVALAIALPLLLTPHAADGATQESPSPMTSIRPLANDFVTVFESPNPATVYCYSPGIARCPSGRLIATLDLGGPGLKDLPGGAAARGKILTSDDRGCTWALRAATPMLHARPFVAGERLYVLGHAGNLMIVRSDDWGDTWGEPVKLTEGQSWHQAPCNVWYARGKVYLVMERNTNTDPSFRGWAVSRLAPVVMAARVGDDLTRREAWTFSGELSFLQVLERYGKPHLLGVPFFTPGNTAPGNPGDPRYMAPIGWLETNIVQFTDPDHVWYDPTGRTFHLFARAHTGSTNLACLAKAVEAEDGSITVSLEAAPSGEPMLYVPMPGGQMKFYILYDEETKLFWLLSSQATDSMTRPDRLPANRFNLPNNERQRLAVHFSRNCVDWCFAGIVAMGETALQSRHYASMVIDGDDLHVLSRSGDARAKNPHDGDLITFHTVRDFRDLVY